MDHVSSTSKKLQECRLGLAYQKPPRDPQPGAAVGGEQAAGARGSLDGAPRDGERGWELTVGTRAAEVSAGDLFDLIWLVKNGVTPKWNPLVEGSMDYNLRCPGGFILTPEQRSELCGRATGPCLPQVQDCGMFLTGK